MIAPASPNFAALDVSRQGPDNCPIYACPTCKTALAFAGDGLFCASCDRKYPILNGIPDFIGGEYKAEFSNFLRLIDRLGLHSRLYETSLWYDPVLRAFGGKNAPTFTELQSTMRDLMPVQAGLLLDVACGPGTWGRRVASDSLTVYGIDLSWGMLREGAAIVHRECIPNVHFAHALVESLPFHDATFDAAYCGGSLHLFPDTVGALAEIGRTMKPDAPLVVVTFLKGDQKILKLREKADQSRPRRVRAFEIPEMMSYLHKAGFVDFDPQPRGTILIFTTRKAWLRS